MNDIQPVIARPVSQIIPVDNMVRYCRELDGTELKVIEVSDVEFITPYPHNDFPCRQAHALHIVALAMKPNPFIWIEPDSIPLKPGWVRALTEEYYRLGKPYMLPFLPPEQPFDIASGIGVYGGDTDTTIPFQFDKHGWDYWMLQNLDGDLARTRLIQHNYGEYDETGHLKREYRFPQDAGIIKPKTVLFHRDRHQDMIYASKKPDIRYFDPFAPPTRFLHHGDIGDVIAALPSIRQLGGGELIITDTHTPHTARQSMKGARYESIVSLIESQPYITGIRWEDNVPRGTFPVPSKHIADSKQYLATAKEAGLVAASIGIRQDGRSPEELLAVLKLYAFPNASPKLQEAIASGCVVCTPKEEIQKPYISYDFTTFRAKFQSKDESLAHWQARHVGLTNPDLSPWLTVEASDMAKGRVLVARTLRYHNPEFDWKKVVEKYGRRLAFIGLDEEHIQFEKETGATVERIIVSSLLEMAKLIKGAELLICNQSCPFWIAVGLGTPIVQEVWPEQPNSQIHRHNARYLRTTDDL